MNPLHTDIAGVVLAGGKSRRMRQDKALLTSEGETFISRVVKTLEQRFVHVFISANITGRYAFLDHPIVPDVFEDSGPLGGIHAVLKTIPTEYLFTVTCDVPFITTEVIDAITEKAEPNVVVIADDGTHIHPLIGLYPKTVSHDLEHFLKSGKRKVQEFLKVVTHKTVDVSHLADKLKNINTLETYMKEMHR